MIVEEITIEEFHALLAERRETTADRCRKLLESIDNDGPEGYN